MTTFAAFLIAATGTAIVGFVAGYVVGREHGRYRGHREARNERIEWQHPAHRAK